MLPDEERGAGETGGTETDQAGLAPTVIGQLRRRSVPPERKPSATFGPTVIGTAGEPRAGRQVPATPPQPKAGGRGVDRPTAIPGTPRQRITVSAGDLRKLSPQAGPRVIEQALRSIGMFVVEHTSERQAVLWGHDAQRRYGALVSRAVDLSQAPVLAKTAGYLRRMTDILALIDIEAACGAAPGGGMLDRILRRASARIDTPAELEIARVEIDQLVELTSAALEDLLSLRQHLEQLGDEIGVTAETIDAAALAAHFLSEHLRGKRDDLARRLLERSMSLTQSMAQLNGSAPTAAAQAEQPLRLIAAIQNVVLVTLPGLLGSFAALSTLARGGTNPTPTQAGEVAFRLRDVLQQLKS